MLKCVEDRRKQEKEAYDNYTFNRVPIVSRKLSKKDTICHTFNLCSLKSLGGVIEHCLFRFEKTFGD